MSSHAADDAHTATGRPVAPGGWRRMLVGFLIGTLAGALVALVLPRDDGPRRTAPGSFTPARGGTRPIAAGAGSDASGRWGGPEPNAAGHAGAGSG